jgi:hypothetical protein
MRLDETKLAPYLDRIRELDFVKRLELKQTVQSQFTMRLVGVGHVFSGAQLVTFRFLFPSYSQKFYCNYDKVSIKLKLWKTFR